jgi:hypothetical protein
MMTFQFKRWKKAIRQFLHTAYSDERLAWLLAHARNGKLAYQSCCCLIGVATADHALRGKTDVTAPGALHYRLAKIFVGAREAEMAFWELGYAGSSRLAESNDELRRRRVIPMIKAEMRYRERSRLRAQGQQMAVQVKRAISGLE